MRQLTYFNAFEMALTQCGNARAWRGGLETGIAVDTDHWALVWQRYDRLARKAERRLRESMGVPKPTYPMCPVCGWPQSICECGYK